MVTCQHCGTPNRVGATYCNTCGFALQSGAPGPGPSSATGAHPAYPTGRLAPQTRLAGCYIVSRTIGQGGMAAVYRATDTRNNSQVAIKEMSQDGLTPDELKEALESFHSEARILMGLKHRNLPRVSGMFSEGARHYLVMEFIEGQTLEQRQAAAGSKALPEREVLSWAEQLCDVLSYLHGQRPPIIFRDLKPANIMVTARGRVKLIDFGIARVFAPGRSRDTQVLGTPGYAPPEQYGKAQTDARADIYALGCTLYQLLSGYDPASTPFALPPLNSRNPSVSPHVQLAIERATQLDRDARYATIADLKRDLLNPAGCYFRSGTCARSLSELVALCRQYPQEAAEHLYAGRFDPWLMKWGEQRAARAARDAVTRIADRAAGLSAFLMAVSAWGTTGQRPTARQSATRPQPRQTSTHAAASAAATATASLVVVQPRSVDFGQLVAGQRGTATVTISGQNGAQVSGSIVLPPVWLRADRLTFSGKSTLVQLHAETSLLPTTGKHYANLQIKSGTQHLYVPVSVEVAAAPVKAAGKSAAKPVGKSAAKTPGSPPPVAQPSTKYDPAQIRRGRLVGFLTAALLAMGLSTAVLVAAPLALASWAPGLAQRGGDLLGIALVLAASLIAWPAALMGTGQRGWRGRAWTTLTGALLGLLLALSTGARQLIHEAVTILGDAKPGITLPANAHWLLLLLIALVALGAAMGAERWPSQVMIGIATFARRRYPLVVIPGAIVAGGALGLMLTQGLIVLAPFAMVAGAILGGWLAMRIVRMLRRVQRLVPARSNP